MAQLTTMQAVAAVFTALVLPFIVQAIKTGAMSGSAARFIAIAASALAGVLVLMLDGVPATPAAWVTGAFSMVGAVQTAYAAFKAVGVTSKWLDALLALGDVGGEKPAE